jgi:membrane protein YqaA with SNARE-associated domain
MVSEIRWPALVSGLSRPARKAARWFSRYGIWSLLFAWLPIVGDALTVIAGALKVNIYPFAALVAIGKATRYVALLWGSEALRSVIAS